MADVSQSPKRATHIDMIRPPLMTQTNSVSPPPSLHNKKQVRRQSSSKLHVDSSEEVPSPHESLFDAECFSGPSSEDSTHGPKSCLYSSLSAITPISSPPDHVENNSYFAFNLTPIIGSTRIIYGHGTPLKTIAEQQSQSTIRSTATTATIVPIGKSNPPSPFPYLPRPRSTSDLSRIIAREAPHLLAGCDTSDLPRSSSLRTPRRRSPFTSNDLETIQKSYHEALSDIVKPGHHSLERIFIPIHTPEITTVYASPLIPVSPPVERPNTPPGYPSWTEAQIRGPNSALRDEPPAAAEQAWGILSASNRLQRFLGIQPSTFESSSQTLVSSSSQTGNRSFVQTRRSVSAPVIGVIDSSVRRAPRFRPPKSMHGPGSLRSHPFAHAPVQAIPPHNSLPLPVPIEDDAPASNPERFTQTGIISAQKWEELNANSEGAACSSTAPAQSVPILFHEHHATVLLAPRQSNGHGSLFHAFSSIAARGRQSIEQRVRFSVGNMGSEDETSIAGQRPNMSHVEGAVLCGINNVEATVREERQCRNGKDKAHEACSHLNERKAKSKVVRVDELASNEIHNEGDEIVQGRPDGEGYIQASNMVIPESDTSAPPNENLPQDQNSSARNMALPLGFTDGNASSASMASSTPPNPKKAIQNEPPASRRCWKCRIEDAIQKAGRIWEASTRLGCSCCCDFDDGDGAGDRRSKARGSESGRRASQLDTGDGMGDGMRRVLEGIPVVPF